MTDHPAHRPWRVQRETELLACPPFLRVTQQSVVVSDGRVIDDFFQVHLRSFAMVVPVLSDGRVQLIRQYKHGPGQVSLGFPAGFIDPGEAPERAAARELREETGLAPASLRALGSFVDNGNQRGSEGHYFLGLDCTSVAAPDAGDLEAFEYLTLSPEEIDHAMATGAFSVVHHVAAWGLARPHIPG